MGSRHARFSRADSLSTLSAFSTLPAVFERTTVDRLHLERRFDTGGGCQTTRWSTIYSKHHFLISLVVGAVIAVVVASSYPGWFLVAYAVVLGVGIDFDHFLVARLNTGEWTAARRCLRNPRIVFTDQSVIFDEGEVGTLRRLLSHVVLGGVGVALFAAVDAFLAAFTAVVLYAHLLSDLVWDVLAEAGRV